MTTIYDENEYHSISSDSEKKWPQSNDIARSYQIFNNLTENVRLD